MQKKVILIDDHSMLRLGIKDYLKTHSSWTVDYEGKNIEDVKNLLEEIKENEQPDSKIVAIVDLSFKNDEDTTNKNLGFEIVRMIRTFDSRFNIPCIIYSTYETAGFIERAMSQEIGAKAYVTKTSSEKNLLAALEAVSSGNTYIQENLRARLTEMQDIYSAFTKKEKDVIKEVASGLQNQQIADKMKISLRTVENYLSNLYDKTGTKNKIELLEFLGLREI